MNPLLEEIDRRLDALFHRLAAGHDAPLSMRLRLEGLLEAAVIIGVASEEELRQRIDGAARKCPDVSLGGIDTPERGGERWQDMHPFPQIPAYMARAPVYPTTGD